MTKVLQLKLLQHINFEEEQHRFKNGSSCNEALFVIHKIKESAIRFQKPAFMCLIDLEKAFDRVRVSDVLKILHHRWVSINITKLIKEIYTNTSVTVSYTHLDVYKRQVGW